MFEESISGACIAWMVASLTAFGIVAMPSSSSAMDCSKARTPVEVAICTNETLKAEDARLSQQYFAVLKEAKASGALYDDDSRHDLLINSQREWLAQREKTCGGIAPDHIGRCIADSLRARASEIAAAGRADEFERTHHEKIQEMVAASVRIETGFGKIYAEYTEKVRSAPDPKSPSLLAEGMLNLDCSNFIYAAFYAKFHTLIDNIDTSAFNFPEELRKDRSDTSILRDPRKIAYATKYRNLSFRYRKDFEPPLGEYVVRYSERPDLEAKCAHYLDVTGMRS